jgi:hypothetical protein
MTDKTVSVPEPLPDHECKYCKTVHVGCCSKACVLKKNPNYPLPSVPTESRPTISALCEAVDNSGRTDWVHKERVKFAIREAYAAASSSLLPVPTQEGICQDCGREYGVWFAPNEIWNLVIPERVGILCPICFMTRADHAAISFTGWELRPENFAGCGESAEQEQNKAGTSSVKVMEIRTPPLSNEQPAMQNKRRISDDRSPHI